MTDLGFAKHSSDRKLIAASGLITFLVGSAILRIAERVISRPVWSFPLVGTSIAQALFWILFVYGLVWVTLSLYGLWKLSGSVELPDRLRSQWWLRQPMLVQIVVFVEHWIMATVYVFLTGDLERGVILAFLSLLHIAVALAIAPRLVAKTD